MLNKDKDKKSFSHSLFRTESKNDKDFIVLNWHGQPIKELALYAESYHCAAKKLVSVYGTTGALRDFEAAPILFLYRHAFELYLKAFVQIGSDILSLHGKVTISLKKILNTHKLTEFIPDFEAIIKEVGWTWDMGIDGLRRKSDFVKLVREFETIDPSSFAFRYPTDKQGNASLPHYFSFNLSTFAQKIDPLLATIDGALTGLKELWNSAVEAANQE
ncbi:MAG: hypothetical protein WC539_00415 [Nitrospirota bacterium]